MLIDDVRLERKLAALALTARQPAEVVARFAARLRSCEDWQLSSINPLAFGEEAGISARAAVDLFVSGVHVGLFELRWYGLCVFCGAREYVYDRLDEIPREGFHCTCCALEISSLLDERIEARFGLHPGVAHIRFDPFVDFASYSRHFVAAEVVHGEETRAYLGRTQRGWARIPAQGAAELVIELEPGASVRLVSFDRHAQVFIRAGVGAREAETELEIDVTDNGLTPQEMLVAPGSRRVRLHNHSARPAGVLVLDGDVDGFRHAMESHRAALRPYLSGQMLLATQRFRALFGVQRLREGFALNIRRSAIVFTDLARSTVLYAEAGDATAYGVVRRHFQALYAAVDAHGGAIVKTMGDSVMAAFHAPADAARAAGEMRAGIDRLNVEIAATGIELRLKVAVHAGPAILVNVDERLDYFGQTVNIAARLLAVTAPLTISVTEEIHASAGVQAVFAAGGWVGVREQVALRGVPGLVTIHCMTRAPDDPGSGG